MAMPFHSGRTLRALAPLAPLLLACACCAAPPTAEDLFERGFRSPTQTFRTFQTGVRADDGRTEYRCLSASFRQRHLLSQLLYLEFRDSWFASKSWLRGAIGGARVVQVAYEEGDDPRHCVLTAAAMGAMLEVHLVREDFVQLYDGDELVADDPLSADIPFEERVTVNAQDDASGAHVRGAARISVALPPVRVTELRIGQDWKIDNVKQKKEQTEEPQDPDGAP